MGLPIARVIGPEELLAVIDQYPPQGALMKLSLTIQGRQATQRHPSGLSDFRRQKVDWVRPKLCQSNSSEGLAAVVIGAEQIATIQAESQPVWVGPWS